MHAAYADDDTLREARRQYFASNRFGDDGGYGDAWVDFKLGPLPFPFPNTPARIRALRYHDLHHVLTGYETTTIGEFEIGAWELGAGCKNFAAAWVLNLAGVASGMVVAPHKVFRAFVRGRRSRSLYGEDLDDLLDVTVAEGRKRFVAPHGDRPQGAGIVDAALFVPTVVAGVAVGLAFAALVVPLVPVGLFNNWRRRRQVAASNA
jgi:hypothetical protein